MNVSAGYRLGISCRAPTHTDDKSPASERAHSASPLVVSTRFSYSTASFPSNGQALRLSFAMALPQWIAWALWAFAASTATAQFNTTVKFTLTSMDPMVDLDAASETWAGVPFTLDDATGYRTSTGRSSGNAGCWFVGSAFDVQGSVNWKGDAPPEGPAGVGLNNPASAFLYYPDTDYHRRRNETRQFNISAGTGPDLLSVSQLDLRAYELRLSFSPYTVLEFHNITVDVPILTQA